MGQALYRKYRSKSLDEVVGQEHITKTLQNALKEGRISHAYLLTGLRGTGKTSIARILAHEINQLPYDGETIHLDIIEIDAASNNGVEDVRDLREKVRLSPTSATYKVYIIDEVHMLSNAAFNALLKTLEEPPEHAIFILATTEAHKLPATIISRTQRFQLRPVPLDKVTAHLGKIAKKEKIEVTDDALALIAQHGEGAFRDSISLLDQLRSVSAGRITKESVEAVLGLAPAQSLAQLVAVMQAGQVQQTVANLESLLGGGTSAPSLSQQLITVLRPQAMTNPALYKLIDQLIEVPRAYNPRLKLEVILGAFALTRQQSPSNESPPKSKTSHTPPKKKPEKPAASSSPKKQETPTSVPTQTTPTKTATTKKSPDDVAGEKEPVATKPTQEVTSINEAQWQQIVATAKENGPTLYTIIRQAIPHFDAQAKRLTITFRFPLHQKRLEESRHLKAFHSILAQVLGGVPEIEIVVNKNAVRHIKPQTSSQSERVEGALPQGQATDNVMQLMGGGEVVNV